MAKFNEAIARLMTNKFVCKVCKSSIKGPNLAVLQGKISCRKCGSKALRPARKK
ncbi:MAG: 50S ribosomal protein L40e [Candidatus Woesearchaeota archaeon]